MHATEHQFRVADETDSADSATDSEFDTRPKRNWLLKCPKSRTNAPLSPPRPSSPAQAPLLHCRRLAAPPAAAAKAASSWPISLARTLSDPSALVPYEVDSATVAWLLAHNQQLSPPVDQHGVGGKPTALVRPCRHTRSLGVQTDALSLDTSCLLEDFLRSSRAVGLLNSGSAAPQQLGRLRFLSRLVAALGLDLQAQLDRLSSERAKLSAQLAAADHDRQSWPAGARPAAGQLCWGVASARPAAAGTASQLRSDLADTFSHLYLLAANQDEKFSPEPPANTLELIHIEFGARVATLCATVARSAEFGQQRQACVCRRRGYCRRTTTPGSLPPVHAQAKRPLSMLWELRLRPTCWPTAPAVLAAYLSPESKVWRNSWPCTAARMPRRHATAAQQQQQLAAGSSWRGCAASCDACSRPPPSPLATVRQPAAQQLSGAMRADRRERRAARQPKPTSCDDEMMPLR
uniref:Uncharacterized protein n=1 Tax=Macrostomum lignano TaxID=282301 RepID=A0A1I8F923_9PLAT